MDFESRGCLAQASLASDPGLDPNQLLVGARSSGIVDLATRTRQLVATPRFSGANVP